jgi:hypothetical protein
VKGKSQMAKPNTIQIQWSTIKIKNGNLCLKVSRSDQADSWVGIPDSQFLGWLKEGDKVTLPSLINAITLSLPLGRSFNDLQPEEKSGILTAILCSTDSDLIGFDLQDLEEYGVVAVSH